MKKKFDVIIVLGYGATEKMKLNQVLKSRLDLAIDLYKLGLAPKIIMSGGFTNLIVDRSEADCMKSYAIREGVKDEDIIKEESSRDTSTNIYLIKKEILEPKNWNRVLVVTSDFHMRRVKLIAKKIFGPEYDLDFRSSSAFLLRTFLFNSLGFEKYMYKLAASAFKKIEDGNNEQIRKVIKLNPFYSKDPEISKMTRRGIRESMEEFGINNRIIKYGCYLRSYILNRKN